MRRAGVAHQSAFRLAMFVAVLPGMIARGQEQRFQVIEPSPPTQTTSAGEALSLDFYYTTQPLDQELSGLGLRLHFNSEVIELTGFSNVLPDSKFRIVEEPDADTDDLDGDPTTNVLTRLTWADVFERKWPGTGHPASVRLFTANFQALPALSEPTSIRVTAISTAAGYELRASAGVISPKVEEEVKFRRGDVNGDGAQDVSDAVSILLLLFVNQDEPACPKAVDVDDDGVTRVTDAVFLLNSLFLNGRGLPPPSMACGEDPTPDKLTCDAFSSCG